ncbi:hypothetical protein TcBrA4_0115440 [Trypanosoma cruzi]|nr:hypothetical protein TcBrA4_0115440 [Trypanosoma cruzi]
MFFCAAGGSRTAPYCKEVRLIGDVANPLVGPDGATAIFGPQKCDSAWEKTHRERVLSRLEHGMVNASAAIVQSNLHGGKASEDKMKQRVEALRHTPGGGGAGGMSGFFPLRRGGEVDDRYRCCRGAAGPSGETSTLRLHDHRRGFL